MIDFKPKILTNKPGSRHVFVDAFARQIKELFFINNKEFIGQDKEKVYQTKEFGKFKKSKEKLHLSVFGIQSLIFLGKR